MDRDVSWSSVPHTASDVVTAALSEAVDRLETEIPRAEHDEPDGVHQARICVRRVRSILFAYSPVFDAEVAIRLSARLRRLGRALGRVRDLEVMVEQVYTHGLGTATGKRMLRAMRRRRARAQTKLAIVLASENVTILLGDIRGFSLREATGEAARMPAEEVFPSIVWVLASAVLENTARADVTPERSDDDLHAVRKAARRLRYAAEVAVPGLDPDLREAVDRLAESAHTVQDVLGAHRDESLFATQIERRARHAGDHGRSKERNEALEVAASARVRAEDNLAHYRVAVEDLYAAVDALIRLRGRESPRLRGQD